MKIGSDEARAILQEIVGFACRITGANTEDYRIEIGEDIIGSHAAIDWCVAIQTKKADDVALIRRVFRVYQQEPDDAVNLCILEWSAKNDTDKSYRETWSKDALDLKSREEMARLFADSIRGLLSNEDRTEAVPAVRRRKSHAWQGREWFHSPWWDMSDILRGADAIACARPMRRSRSATGRLEEVA